MLMFPKPQPKRRSQPGKDEAHLRLVRRCPCLACLAPAPTEAAHVRFTDMRHGKINPGMQRKPADRWAVPLCDRCHRVGRGAQHSTNERVWWEQHRIDPHAAATAIFGISSASREAGDNEDEIVARMRAAILKAHRGISDAM